MATKIWIFLSNTFYKRTAESIKKALSLTTDHLAKLFANMADADIAAIYTDYLPIHQAFLTAYNQLQSKLGLYHGKTQTFEEMIEQMTYTELNVWRGKVFAVFPEGTPNATAIFPQGKKPFYDGTYEQRVEAVETLATTLATFTGEPALVTLAAQVDAYHSNILGARALQQTDEGSTETLRTNLKNAHKTLTDWMYRNLGRLMSRYYTNPEQIENYFDLSLLRSSDDEDEEPNVTVSGILTSNATGLPIAGAQFVMGPYTFTSAADGSFSKSFFIEAATTYNVSITAAGFETINTTFQFTPNVNITQDLQMSPSVATGTISGAVKDSGTLMGLPNATVNLVAPGVNIMLTADASGNYNGNGIPVGTYTATASAANHISQSVSVTINANANTVQDFNLVVMP